MFPLRRRETIAAKRELVISILCAYARMYNVPYIHFNACGVKLLRILTFSNFCVFMFVDGHVLLLHKSLIQFSVGV